MKHQVHSSLNGFFSFPNAPNIINGTSNDPMEIDVPQEHKRTDTCRR